MEGRSYEGVAARDEIQIDERFWGPGTEPILRQWLRESYDPDTMPTLQVATVKGREGLWLLGWNASDSEYPPLLEFIFGRDYARAQLDQARALRDDLRGIPGGSFGQGRP